MNKGLRLNLLQRIHHPACLVGGYDLMNKGLAAGGGVMSHEKGYETEGD